MNTARSRSSAASSHLRVNDGVLANGGIGKDTLEKAGLKSPPRVVPSSDAEGVLAMMGRGRWRRALFCEFSIEDHVPEGHLLRRIDCFVELSGIHRFLAPFYSTWGGHRSIPR